MRRRRSTRSISLAKTIALVGADSLIGREIRDVFADSRLLAQLQLFAGAEEGAGLLTELGGEAAILGKLSRDDLAGSDAVFLAGSAESAVEVIDMPDGPVLIDLTYAAEDHIRARLRAPAAETEESDLPEDAIHVIAHPAAIALALLLSRLHDTYAIERSICHIFEPVSERGAKGIDELQQQTTNLLSFKGLPKLIFDAQVSFNMLARYGDAAPVLLEHAELRIERHLASLLAAGGAPPPSIRLLQAPVFHGYTFSLWVELEDNPGVEAIEEALSLDPIDLRASDLEPPNIVSNAGQGGIAVGGIAPDRNDARGIWIWIVADNLRLMAENAIAVLRQVI
jgi:aspartate-semialdehyde dehydrogenase